MAISGYLERDQEQLIYTVTRTRRRINEIVASLDVYEEITKDLACSNNGLLKVIQPKGMSEEMRVILGLTEGYNEKGETPISHSIEEVRAILPAQINCHPAKIVAARPGIDSIYKEEAAIIEGPISVRAIADIAEKFRQVRFTIEDIRNKKSLTYEAISNKTKKAFP